MYLVVNVLLFYVVLNAVRESISSEPFICFACLFCLRPVYERCFNCSRYFALGKECKGTFLNIFRIHLFCKSFFTKISMYRKNLIKTHYVMPGLTRHPRMTTYFFVFKSAQTSSTSSTKEYSTLSNCEPRPIAFNTPP